MVKNTERIAIPFYNKNRLFYVYDLVLYCTVNNSILFKALFYMIFFYDVLFYMTLFYMIMFYKTIVIPDIVQGNDLHDIGLHVLQDNCL